MGQVSISSQVLAISLEISASTPLQEMESMSLGQASTTPSSMLSLTLKAEGESHQQPCRTPLLTTSSLHPSQEEVSPSDKETTLSKTSLSTQLLQAALGVPDATSTPIQEHLPSPTLSSTSHSSTPNFLF